MSISFPSFYLKYDTPVSTPGIKLNILKFYIGLKSKNDRKRV